MLAFIKSKERWILILFNIVFLLLPIVVLISMTMFLAGYTKPTFIVTSALNAIKLISSGWFLFGVVLNALLDIWVIALVLAAKKTNTVRKFGLATVAVALIFIVIWPIVSSINTSSIVTWFNRLIGGV